MLEDYSDCTPNIWKLGTARLKTDHATLISLYLSILLPSYIPPLKGPLFTLILQNSKYMTDMNNSTDFSAITQEFTPIYNRFSK